MENQSVTWSSMAAHFFVFFILFFYSCCSNFVRMKDILGIEDIVESTSAPHFLSILELTWLVLWILAKGQSELTSAPIGRSPHRMGCVFLSISWPYVNSTLYHNQLFWVDDLWPFLFCGCFFHNLDHNTLQPSFPNSLVTLLN